jgi:hypothetical protein
MEISIEVPKITKTIPFLYIHPKESKSAYNRNICIPMFIVALFTIAKKLNQSRCPSING